MKGKDVVLGLLLKKKRTGYEVKEYFETVFSHFYDGSFGMIYPTLRDLEKNGYINKKVIVQDGKPNKNEFSITKSGYEQFMEYLNSPVKKEIRKSDFFMRLYFGEYVDSENIISIINNEIQEKEKLLNQLQVDYKKWQKNLTLYQQLSFDIGIEQYESEIKILKEFLLKNESQF
ncbi:PadR family transcriptional regulator [Staphylococcus simulans]